MAKPVDVNDLAQRELKARKQAELSSNNSARIAHLARADGYAEKIRTLKADDLA